MYPKRPSQPRTTPSFNSRATNPSRMVHTTAEWVSLVLSVTLVATLVEGPLSAQASQSSVPAYIFFAALVGAFLATSLSWVIARKLRKKPVIIKNDSDGDS